MDAFRYYMKRLGRCFLFSHYATFMTVMISFISVQFFVDMSNRGWALALEILCILFYAFTEVLVGMAFGTRQYKATCSNAYQRNPDSPDLLAYYEKRELEYAPLNGALVGVISHYPLYLLLLSFALTKGNAHAVFYTLILGSTSVVTAPLVQVLGVQGTASAALSLVCVPVTLLCTFVGYLLGAMRVKNSRAAAERLESRIDGEN